MRRELEKLRKENAALAGKVREGRSAIANTEQLIAAAVDNWKVRPKIEPCNLKLNKEDNDVMVLLYFMILYHV